MSATLKTGVFVLVAAVLVLAAFLSTPRLGESGRLSEEGELSFTVPGFTGPNEDVLQLPRSNPSNIIFINESSEERRLTVDLGVEEITTEDGATGVVDSLACTTLVEEDGQQLLTLTIGIPSAAQEDGYRFFVPGVESAELELVVP